jgi:hypothetical protein
MHFRHRSLASWSLPALIFLSGCSPKVECDSPETRSSVLKIVSDDHKNALASFAAKNPDIPEKSANPESAQPLYLLGEKIVTLSTSADKRTLTCSGAISAIVGDTKASKEVNFTVQRSSDDKISVSVVPFQF